jgi:Zn ribbon nucleic-acid-binding protein
MTLRLKSCPRCRTGDLVLERDLGRFKVFVCLQCGHEDKSRGSPEISAHSRGNGVNYGNTGRQIPTRKGAA